MVAPMAFTMFIVIKIIIIIDFLMFLDYFIIKMVIIIEMVNFTQNLFSFIIIN